MSELTSKIWMDSASKIVDFEQVTAWLEEYQTITSKKKKERLQNLITMTCMPLVKKVSRTLARRSTDPVEDIIQIGSVGLIKAIHSYNPDVSRNFKSYATYLITGEIRHYLRDKASMIKAPRAIQELAYRVHQLTVEMIEELGERPTEKELASKMDVPIDQIQAAIDADRRKSIVSLDQLAFQENDEFSSWNDKIADISYENLQQLTEDRMLLAKSLQNIEPVLQQIVEMTYFKDLNQVEIANRLGLSQMQVSRKLKKALSILHDIIQQMESGI